MIRPATESDAEAIAEIYNHYVANTVVTFEEQPVSKSDFIERIRNVTSLGFPWFVAEENGAVIGYAYAAKFKDRSAYRHSVETTVYLSSTAVSKGWGTQLYQALFEILRQKSVHVAIGGITLPNPASVALHEKFGMKQVAHFKEVGYKFNRWLDVGYWQVEFKA